MVGTGVCVHVCVCLHVFVQYFILVFHSVILHFAVTPTVLNIYSQPSKTLPLTQQNKTCTVVGPHG